MTRKDVEEILTNMRAKGKSLNHQFTDACRLPIIKWAREQRDRDRSADGQGTSIRMRSFNRYDCCHAVIGAMSKPEELTDRELSEFTDHLRGGPETMEELILRIAGIIYFDDPDEIKKCQEHDAEVARRNLDRAQREVEDTKPKK